MQKIKLNFVLYLEFFFHESFMKESNSGLGDEFNMGIIFNAVQTMGGVVIYFLQSFLLLSSYKSIFLGH